MPPTQRPLRLEAAILSRMRSEVTSRSNWANDSSTFSVSRPIEVVVLNCWVTDTKDTVEVLLKPLVGRDAGVDRAANDLRRPGIHGAEPFDRLSRNPKNLGPLQRVSVIANATFVRLR